MGSSSGGNRAQREAEAFERQRQAAILDATNRVRGIFGGPQREASIGELVAATRAMLAGDLNQQAQRTNRRNRFDLARTGLFGGSLQADRQRQLAEAYGRGLMAVEGRAQDAGQRVRDADEATQARILGMVQDGLDMTTGSQQAAQGLRSNLAAGRSAEMVQGLGDAFGAFGNVFLQNRDVSAANSPRPH